MDKLSSKLLNLLLRRSEGAGGRGRSSARDRLVRKLNYFGYDKFYSKAFDLRINKLIRHYFKLRFKHKLIHTRYVTRRKRLLFLNKIYTSKAEIKHTNTKAVVTVYLYNREKSVLFKKIRKLQNVTFSYKKLKRLSSTLGILVFKNSKRNKKLKKQYKYIKNILFKNIYTSGRNAATVNNVGG